jgi:hypothetical protein
MALNPNHIIEETGDQKYAVVEKNCTEKRVAFLKPLLEQNKLTVVVVKSPPPKVAPKPSAEGEVPVAAPETFTVGTTDLTFNPVNAIFNRELKRADGRVVTPVYWQQLVSEEKEEEWYWKR